MNRILPLLFLLLVIISCTHFTPIKSSDVFSNKYKSVSKVSLKNQKILFVENPDSNKIYLADSVFFTLGDSGLVKINDKDVIHYFESKFSFGKTISLVGGLGSLGLMLWFISLLNM